MVLPKLPSLGEAPITATDRALSSGVRSTTSADLGPTVWDGSQAVLTIERDRHDGPFHHDVEALGAHGQRPFQTGSRFSAKARAPSRASSDASMRS